MDFSHVYRCAIALVPGPKEERFGLPTTRSRKSRIESATVLFEHVVLVLT